MTTDIFIVSFYKDREYLYWCLKSIEKFASGFRRAVLVIPKRDERAFAELDIPKFVDVRMFDEAPDKGMLHHMSMICHADVWCTDADRILHMDSDCIFTKPVTPLDYHVDGKPVLMYARYDWLIKDTPAIINWKVATEKALGFSVEHEFMRRHPAVHILDTYRILRKVIFEQHGESTESYILKQKNEFPQGFTEFPALGAIAWEYLHDKYHWHNQETHGFPEHKLLQFWSHRPITESGEIFNGGQRLHDSALNIIREILD